MAWQLNLKGFTSQGIFLNGKRDAMLGSLEQLNELCRYIIKKSSTIIVSLVRFKTTIRAYTGMS